MPADGEPREVEPGLQQWHVPVFTAAPVSTPLLPVAEQPEESPRPPDSLPFSAAGYQELKARLDGYLAELVGESRRIARRQQADVISPAYVRQAGDHLGMTTTRRTLALAGSFGWASVGATIPSLLDAAGGKQMTPSQVAFSATLGMLGAFLVAMQFLRG